MTLSARNNILIGGIVFCSISVLFIITASFDAVPVFSSINIEDLRRSTGIFQDLTGRLLGPNFYAVYISIIFLTLFSLASIGVIYHYFEKTKVSEMLYVILFILSAACESARLILPLQQVYKIPFLYPLIASRILLFSRYFGFFSLFTASVFASGFETQKARYPILIIAVTSLIIALGTPVDTFTWSTNFNTINGNVSMFRLLDTGILIVTLAGFLVSAYTRGSKEYVFISVGTFLAVMGRNILFTTDSWACLAGMILLSLGTWLICSRLHKVYLWL